MVSPTPRQNRRKRGRRISYAAQLFCLLTWHAHASKPILQPPRIPRTTRSVPYAAHNTRDFPKFWIPSSTQNPVSRYLRKESTGDSSSRTNENKITRWKEDVAGLGKSGSVYYTSYLADASVDSPDGIDRGRRAEDGKGGDSGRSFHSIVRALFSPPGEALDHPPRTPSAGGDTTNSASVTAQNVTWNVTAEVDAAILANETSQVFTTVEDSQASETSDAVRPLFQPMRLRAILAESSEEGGFLDPSDRETLFHEILSPALLAWSSALRVVPVEGNLTVDEGQLLDGKSCGPGLESGLPSIEVPEHHLTLGIPDTDMIVYLSLGFVQPSSFEPPPVMDPDGVGGLLRDSQNQTVDSNGTACEDGGSSSVPCPARSANGWPSTGNSTEAHAVSYNGTCTGDYLAAASFCSTDQHDRPTAALLHLCIGPDFFEEDKRRRNTMTLMHELGHALGFNSLSMAHFRRPDGSPITDRGEDGKVQDTIVECTGPNSGSSGIPRRQQSLPLPSPEILQFREVRGGVRVAEIVTPSVVQVVRNHFDCPRLTGAELESGEALPLFTSDDVNGCLGDHWERRLFPSDLMNPIVEEDNFSTRISTLTLAYFADSGWYQVDLSRAASSTGWGRGSGCAFVDDTCIGKNGEVPPQNAPFFCNVLASTEIQGCTPDLSRKAVCSMGQNELDLPPEYQYFQGTYGSNFGGFDPYMDFCPVFIGYEDGLCSGTQVVRASSLERFGRRNSRCIVGDAGIYGDTALCLPIACVVEDRSLRIGLDGDWYTCDHENQEIDVISGLSIRCPDPRRICPTFYCPYDCLGTGGFCDFESGQCLCEYESEAFGPQVGPCGDFSPDSEGKPDTGSPFFKPESDRNLHEHMPHPDDPLSDYYVPDSESLTTMEDDHRERLLEPWVVGLISSLTAVLVMAMIASGALAYQKLGPDSVPVWFRTENVSPPNHDDNQRNKDKMVATVLVDLRIQNNDRSLPVSNLSLAETDCQLTDSQASGQKSECFSIKSSPNSDGLSEFELSQSDLSDQDDQGKESPQTKPEKEIPMVIRRRKVNEN